MERPGGHLSEQGCDCSGAGLQQHEAGRRLCYPRRTKAAPDGDPSLSCAVLSQPPTLTAEEQIWPSPHLTCLEQRPCLITDLHPNCQRGVSDKIC